MTENKKGLLQRIRAAGWGAIVLLFAAGVVFWGGFNWT
ncbi:MAG: cytochrome c-type protein NapC, partial [Thauera phenolivorans]|nr:cytochrome c-type protein NapC [Thauera phenolivorans]